MFKQIILPLLLVAAFVTGVGLFVKNSKNVKLPGIPTPIPTASSPKNVTVGNAKIQIEIANTQNLRAKGLSGRTSLEENSGMLFIFDAQNVTPVFWMKDMLIPIDIIWINSKGSAVQINKNVSPATFPKIFYPPSDIKYVLEISAGWSDKNKIKIGDAIVVF